MKISLITITYNSSKTLPITFNSVLKQNYLDIEYIIVDGESKDNTISIIKEYESKFNGRMKWISEPDKGIYDAMNKGILMATGDIVGILNSDDILYDDHVLEDITRVFETKNVECLYSVRTLTEKAIDSQLLKLDPKLSNLSRSKIKYKG